MTWLGYRLVWLGAWALERAGYRVNIVVDPLGYATTDTKA